MGFIFLIKISPNMPRLIQDEPVPPSLNQPAKHRLTDIRPTVFQQSNGKKRVCVSAAEQRERLSEQKNKKSFKNMNMILGFFQIVSAAKGRCEKLGHAVFMVWLIVVLGIYPTVYCSSSFSFLGHPDKFHICFLEKEKSH